MTDENNYKNYSVTTKLSDAFWTGLFLAVSVVLLWLGFNYINGNDEGTGFIVKVKFENVYGLEKGNEIIFSGLVIGSVKKVDTLGGSMSEALTPIVTLNINESYSDLDFGLL